MRPKPSAMATMPDCSDQKMRLNGAFIGRADVCGNAGASVSAFPAGDCR